MFNLLSATMRALRNSILYGMLPLFPFLGPVLLSVLSGCGYVLFPQFFTRKWMLVAAWRYEVSGIMSENLCFLASSI